jgi:hypothetical protein
LEAGKVQKMIIKERREILDQHRFEDGTFVLLFTTQLKWQGIGLLKKDNGGLKNGISQIHFNSRKQMFILILLFENHVEI